MLLIMQEKIKNVLKDGTDNYYLSIMNGLSSGKKFYWNWGAFIGGPFWLAYRKMYLYSSVCLILIVPLLIIMLLPNNAEHSSQLEQDVRHAILAASRILVILLQLFFSLILGIWGNNLYYRHIRKKIEKGYHLCKGYEATGIFVALCFMFFFVLMPNAYLKDKALVKKSLKEVDNWDTSINNKNIESVTSVSSHYIEKFSKIERGDIFCINWEIFCLSHFSSIWFFYKKMYKYGFMILTAEIIYYPLALFLYELTAQYAEFYHKQSSFLSFLFFVGAIFIPNIITIILFLGGANRLYYRFITQKCLKDKIA
ncbi:MAG: DUF2628 domain-containing protein [Holosporaceae bacterium]|jgi:hypothetical protein|nr:DUF2628 domain-containing protein [Holosporaceae bacterium]